MELELTAVDLNVTFLPIIWFSRRQQANISRRRGRAGDASLMNSNGPERSERPFLFWDLRLSFLFVDGLIRNSLKDGENIRLNKSIN